MRSRKKIMENYLSNKTKISSSNEWTELVDIKRNQGLLLEVLLDIRKRQLNGKKEVKNDSKRNKNIS